MVMAFPRVVFLTAVMVAAYCKKPKTSHVPDEELLAYWMGEDAPHSQDSFLDSSLDFFAHLELPHVDVPLPSLPDFLSDSEARLAAPLIALFIVLGAAAFAGNAFFTSRWMNTWEKNGIASPHCYSLLGNTLQIANMGGLRPSLRYWYGQYGKVFGIHMNKQPVLVVADIEMAETILENDNGNFGDRYGVPRCLRRELAGKSVFLPGSSRQWQGLRDTLTTAFSHGNLTYMVHRICRCASNLGEYMEDIANVEINAGLCTNLKELMTSYSYDTLTAMILGEEVDHYNSSEHEFLNALNCTFEGVKDEFCGVTVPKKIKRLRKFFQDKIKSRREQHRDGMVDFLDIFLFAGSAPNTDSGVTFPTYYLNSDEIVGTLLHLVLHGHEPLVSIMQFILRMLAYFPDHQQVVRSEIDNHITTEEPTYEDVCKLPFMDLVLKEVLRMFPPVQEIWRYASAASTVEEVPIPERCAILIPLNLIHADSEYFLDPEQFDPERYHQTNDNQTPMSDVFLSFGSGARHCVGLEVALLQIKVALIYILRKVQLERPIPKEEEDELCVSDGSIPMIAGLKLKDNGLLRPLNPIHLKLVARRPQDVFKLTPRCSDEQQQDKMPVGLDKEREMLLDNLSDHHVHFLPKLSSSFSSQPSASTAANTASYSSGYSYTSRDTTGISGTSDSSPDSVSTKMSSDGRSLESMLIEEQRAQEQKQSVCYLSRSPLTSEEEEQMFYDATSKQDSRTSNLSDENDLSRSSSPTSYEGYTTSPVSGESSYRSAELPASDKTAGAQTKTGTDNDAKGFAEKKHKKKKKKKLNTMLEETEEISLEGKQFEGGPIQAKKEANIKDDAEEGPGRRGRADTAEAEEDTEKKKKQKKKKNKTKESWQEEADRDAADTAVAAEDPEKKQKRKKKRPTGEKEGPEGVDSAEAVAEDPEKKKKKKKNKQKDAEKDEKFETGGEASYSEKDAEMKKKKKKKDKGKDEDDFKLPSIIVESAEEADKKKKKKKKHKE